MSVRSILPPWESVPDGPVTINAAHPLFSRLVGGCCPGAEIDWRGKPLGGVRTRDNSPDGMSALGSTTGYVTCTTQGGLAGRSTGGSISTHHYTVLILAHDVGDGYILDDAGVARNSIRVSGGNFYMAGASADMFGAAGATVPSAGLVRIAAYSGQWGGAQPTVRINGTTYTGSNTNQDSWVAPACTTWFGSAYYPSPNRFVGRGLFAWVVRGSLTAREIDEFFADPWEFFEPRRIWVPVSAGGGAQTVAIGQASETDTAQALTAAQAATIGQASETDLAQALSTAQAQTLGQAAETDTAQALSSGAVVAIGQASETDAAQALSAAQALAIGQAAETDEAQPVAYSSPGVIGQASETDAAQALQSNQVAAIGQASETDAAQPLTAVSSATIGMALEIDTANAFSAQMALAIGQATETDTAQALTVGSTGGGTGASAADVWDYMLSNGKTAEENVVEIHAMLSLLTTTTIADAVWAKVLP